MERSNCTLSLQLYRKTSRSLCVSTLGNSTATAWWYSFFLHRHPPPSYSRWSSGYFLVFQLPTWSAFRPFRGLSLKRSSNTSQVMAQYELWLSPLLLSSPSFLPLGSNVHVYTPARGVRLATAHPPSWKSIVFTFVEPTKKLSPYRFLRGIPVQGTTDTWLLNRNGIKDVRRRVSFIVRFLVLCRVAGYSFLIFKPRDVSGPSRRGGPRRKSRIPHSREYISIFRNDASRLQTFLLHGVLWIIFEAETSRDACWFFSSHTYQ